LQIWTPLIRDYPLHILNFDGGMEIRALGPDKGSAVREILAEAAPAAAVAYLGDDRTDEDAFRALQGKGLTALVRPEHRATAADLWLKPPEELIEFLHSWLRATGGDA
jgi:trehalose 6-phosphate phosphatase